MQADPMTAPVDQSNLVLPAAASLVADAERLCWALRRFVSLTPAGDLCAVKFTVGVQQFTVGAEPMPEDEAAHFAGLFVFALAGAFRTLRTGYVELGKDEGGEFIRVLREPPAQGKDSNG